MKRYEVAKNVLFLGSKCDWYIKENADAIKKNGIAGRFCKEYNNGYFVEAVEVVRDDMREFRPVYEVRNVVAGPFASVEDAEEWKAANC